MTIAPEFELQYSSPDSRRAQGEGMGPVEGAADLESCEKVVLTLMKDRHAAAQGLSSARKRTMAKYLLMKQGIDPDPIGEDRLKELGVYWAHLAKHGDVLRSNLMNELIPDPTQMDFFEMVSKWAGGEQWAEMQTAYLRDKFKIMRPHDAPNGFYELWDRLEDDRITLGTMAGMVTYEVAEGLDEDDFIEGPTAQWIDVFNLWPHRTDLTNPANIDFTLYNPVTDEELDRGGFLNVEAIREAHKASANRMRDPVSMPYDNVDGSGGTPAEDDGQLSNPADLYERYVFLGRLPKHALAEGFVSAGIDPAIGMMTLGAAYGWDATEAVARHIYWDIEWVGHTLAQMRPYPSKLPIGRGPIFVDRYHRRNGSFWGYGIYDRARWDERLKNYFDRNLAIGAVFAANPAVIRRPDMLKPEFRASEGDQPTLTPGRIYDAINAPPNSALPWEQVIVNEKSIPILAAASMKTDQDMREATLVTSAVEGQDKSPTATQNANNLAQSLSGVKYQAKREENGALREVVVRAYVIAQDAMRILGTPATVQVSAELNELRTLTVLPEHFVSETLLDVRMTGSTSPGNKQGQIEAFTKGYLPIMAATGRLDWDEVNRVMGKLLNMTGVDRLLRTVDPHQIAQAVQNILMLWGPEGLKTLPPYALQMVFGIPGLGMTSAPGMEQLTGGEKGGMGPGGAGGNPQNGGGVSPGMMMGNQAPVRSMGE